MTKYYDIHCHVFNKNIFNRNISSILITLAELSDNISSNNQEGKIKQILTQLNSGLDTIMSSNTEEVFNIIDKAYKKQFIITPLMFDLTYVDDNDGNPTQNSRYFKNIKHFIVKIKYLIKSLKIIYTNNEIDDLLTNILNNINIYQQFLDDATNEDELLIDSNNYSKQIKDLEELASNFPNVKPFFSIDTRRERNDNENLLELVKEKIKGDNAKFIGIKLYAPAGFSPTDPILMGTDNNEGIYKYCQENNIPITIHNSNSGFSCFSRQLKIWGDFNLNGEIIKLKGNKIKFETKFFSILEISSAIKERAEKLNHPKLWEKVLKKYPNLVINFAHFGGSSQIMEYVNYSFPYDVKKIDAFDFEDLIDDIENDEDKLFIKNYYEFHENGVESSYYLKNNINDDDRKKLWLMLYSKDKIDNWSRRIYDIISNPQYPNTYTDLSCFSEGSNSIKEALNKFKVKIFDEKSDDYTRGKFLYGTDFFFSLLSGITLDNYIKDFIDVFGKEGFDIIASRNPEKFLGIN